MATHTNDLSLASILSPTSCVAGVSSCDDVWPSPLVIGLVFLGLIALVVLVNVVRSRSRE